MKDAPLMKCGHAANSTLDGIPVCVICYGIRPGADQVVDDRPSLEGRRAVCCYKNHLARYVRDDKRGQHGMRPSSYDLAYFKHQPDQPFDSYYCGCHGWD